eukprot:CAMPEP_0202960450 /NCGR_PEP_ID=MMETSP1396-20130829/4589_1 /ASSEMBLY_ACC=CAM_ASM_000872 /TAXON_ID= /ORGANISM="Pseudokeronopsis sp., Strain Brazil" /LENGTH=125 /DNA_ID=CAMNT_0049679673 /DNA_START=164 /DNA_END=541 /DNA_ORIENTATION=+
MRAKKARTEATQSTAGNLATLDDFGARPNIQPPTRENLKQLQQSISSAFRTFRPTVLDGQQLFASSLGPCTSQNHEDILMERDGFEEEKFPQGQGSSSNSQTSHEKSAETIEDISKMLVSTECWS